MPLSKNHKRSFRATLYFTEKKIDEIIGLCSYTSHGASYQIEENIGQNDKKNVLSHCKLIKDQIRTLIKKYGLSEQHINQSMAIHTTLDQIWETLADTNINNMKKYGAFNAGKVPNELDKDMNDLLALTEGLKQMVPRSSI